jgi:hypothetical protein
MYLWWYVFMKNLSWEASELLLNQALFFVELEIDCNQFQSRLEKYTSANFVDFWKIYFAENKKLLQNEKEFFR